MPVLARAGHHGFPERSSWMHGRWPWGWGKSLRAINAFKPNLALLERVLIPVLGVMVGEMVIRGTSQSLGIELAPLTPSGMRKPPPVFVQ